MDTMNLSRRDFLKLLGAAAATAGLSTVLPDLPLPGAEMAKIDAPVAPENPISWIMIDGQTYAAGRIDIFTEIYDVTSDSDTYRQYIPMNTVVGATVFGYVDPCLLFDMRERSIVFMWYSHRYECSGYVSSVVPETWNGEVVTTIDIALTGKLLAGVTG